MAANLSIDEGDWLEWSQGFGHAELRGGEVANPW